MVLTPGVSNVMAAHMISLARKEYAAEWRPRGTQSPAAESPADAGNGSAAKPPAPEGDAVEPTRVGASASSVVASQAQPPPAFLGNSCNALPRIHWCRSYAVPLPSRQSEASDEQLHAWCQVRYTYYTAGSGGVGPTIMETSMLLAGTDVVVFKDGERVCQPADPQHSLWPCSSRTVGQP